MIPDDRRVPRVRLLTEESYQRRVFFGDGIIEQRRVGRSREEERYLPKDADATGVP